ncbi:hypothetical protein QNA23_20400 [Rhodococcus erythropolis]|uniref:hypothetical protein n=1 Tax=Rhodococcus erythropolis TaxID=1833 RepID=UPI0024B95B81|nr:hypothetical protein [Rhodococcus erythropolis]MDJ0405866.1 hypothetical protein [Rhodococcus erythropolis]
MSETFMVDEFGYPQFRISSESEPGDACFSFKADSVTAWTSDKKPVEFEKYLHGMIKWDSCSHLYFGMDEERDGNLHLCGVHSFRDHVALLKFLYELAFERMGQKPQDGEEWS